MFSKSIFISVLLCLAIAPVWAQQELYVNSATGNNRNDGSKESPLKNIQRAIDQAKAGDIIRVSEGNYYGTTDIGFINVNKAVTIMGGYSPDFSTRDVLKHLTMVQPTLESNKSAGLQGTLRINVTGPNTEVVIDGLIFDRGNSNAYHATDGKPEGVESGLLVPFTASGMGGPDLSTANARSSESPTIRLGGNSNITIKNCAIINAPNYGILGTVQGNLTITNCIFINCRMAAVESAGGLAARNVDCEFSYNTILFTWSRLKDYGDMGYGFRFGTQMNTNATNNIFGCTIQAALDRTRVSSAAAREAQRITAAEHNIFFLNKRADLAMPGMPYNRNIMVNQFEDIDELAKVDGNKSLTDPGVFKGVINEPYLNGFLAASYSETTDLDRDSPANQFRSAMGMNLQGTMSSSATMFANRYPWEEALKFFGAIEGYGAQKINN